MKHLLLAIALVAVLAPAADAKLKIVTTTTDYADIARRIGGDRVDVQSVMKGPESVHNVMATPPAMVALNGADLFVHGGLDAEPWRDNLVKGARNPKVLPGKPGNVDMSTGIELKHVPHEKIDRSHGDVHAFGDPHYQLSPANAQRMAVTLLKAMVEADPANAAAYKANAKQFVLEMADVAKGVREQFAPYEGLKVVTFHRAWEYFADAVPVRVVGTIEPKPGITPSPAQVQETVRRMKEQGVRVVIVETYNDDKLAQYVADQAGAKLVRLPDHVLAVPEADGYPKLFRYNADKLIEAARAAGVEPKAAAVRARPGAAGGATDGR